MSDNISKRGQMKKKIFKVYLVTLYFALILYFFLTVFFWEKVNDYFLIALIQMPIVLAGSYTYKFYEKLSSKALENGEKVICGDDFLIRDKFSKTMSYILIIMFVILVVILIFTSGISFSIPGSPRKIDGLYYLNNRGYLTEITYNDYVTYRTIALLSGISGFIIITQLAIVCIQDFKYMDNSKK